MNLMDAHQLNTAVVRMSLLQPQDPTMKAVDHRKSGAVPAPAGAAAEMARTLQVDLI